RPPQVRLRLLRPESSPPPNRAPGPSFNPPDAERPRWSLALDVRHSAWHSPARTSKSRGHEQTHDPSTAFLLKLLPAASCSSCSNFKSAEPGGRHLLTDCVANGSADRAVPPEPKLNPIMPWRVSLELLSPADSVKIE